MAKAKNTTHKSSTGKRITVARDANGRFAKKKGKKAAPKRKK